VKHPKKIPLTQLAGAKQPGDQDMHKRSNMKDAPAFKNTDPNTVAPVRKSVAVGQMLTKQYRWNLNVRTKGLVFKTICGSKVVFVDQTVHNIH